MKIEKFGRSRGRALRQQPASSSDKVARGGFPDVLEEQQEVTNLEAALAEIDRYGGKLREAPTFANLRRYKKAVRAFLSQVVPGIFTLEEESFFDMRGRRRVYLKVAAIDKRLEELTQLFLTGQEANLHLAQRLDEIRGLVLDLYS